ncbi:hypothetical protein ACFPM3_04950 [Streptomyces coeruleoprunus]|uniref:Uncharacterized protein n=1 Tax=Streptomyces coeruleoprunus TaxID=285563 RepID=A0ABV9XBF5_9ACTN
MHLRRIAAHVAACGVLFALATPATAAPQATAPGACRPADAHTGTDRTDSDAGCLEVALRMAEAPALGSEATLDIEVRSVADRSEVQLDVELPAGLVWVSPPTGLRSSTAASRVPAHGGQVHRAAGEGHAGRERPWRLSGTVKAVGTGPVGIRATATTPVPAQGGFDGDSDSVFLTVGAERSAFGIAVKDVNPVSPVKDDVTRAHPHLTHRPAGPAPKRSAEAGTACATGSWNYVDHTGLTRVSGNALVTVYDSDAKGSHDVLATGLTGADGRYLLCFDNTDEEGGGQDLYVQFATENPSWVIRNGRSRQAYRFATAVRPDTASGGTVDFGAFQPADAALMRGVEAFDTLDAAWAWTPGTACWDARDTACRRGLVNWAPDSTDGTYYSLRGNAVHLAAEDPDAPVLVLHEFGHALMDDVYEDDFPYSPNCSPHYIPRTSSAGCAWTEGFPTWYGAMVLDDPTFRWPGGRTLDLEGPTWGTTGWDNGDTAEGRVVGAMIDLADAANEGGDTCSEDPTGPMWNTFLGHVSHTFREFWAHRAADGHDVGAAALGCLLHNTIDYRS